MNSPKSITDDYHALQWISEDLDDDEPNVLDMVRSKKMHDVLHGRIPRELGKVSEIWLESANNDQHRWLRFVYPGASFAHDNILAVTIIPQIYNSDYVSIRLSLSISFHDQQTIQQVKPSYMAKWLTIVTGCRFLANDLENLGVLNQDDWIWHCRGRSSFEYRRYSDLICDDQNRQLWSLFGRRGNQILIFPRTST